MRFPNGNPLRDRFQLLCVLDGERAQPLLIERSSELRGGPTAFTRIRRKAEARRPPHESMARYRAFEATVPEVPLGPVNVRLSSN